MKTTSSVSYHLSDDPITLHRLTNTPSGRALYTYFAAILRVTGMEGGAAYPLNRFMNNFSGHMKAGRIERCESGYRLTRSGIEYFADRFRTGSRQRVYENEVDQMVSGILRGGDGWIAID